MHADRQLVFVCAQICRLFPCGSLYTQPSLPFSQPIAIPGGAFWLGGGVLYSDIASYQSDGQSPLGLLLSEYTM